MPHRHIRAYIHWRCDTCAAEHQSPGPVGVPLAPSIHTHSEHWCPYCSDLRSLEMVGWLSGNTTPWLREALG